MLSEYNKLLYLEHYKLEYASKYMTSDNPLYWRAINIQQNWYVMPEHHPFFAEISVEYDVHCERSNDYDITWFPIMQYIKKYMPIPEDIEDKLQELRLKKGMIISKFYDKTQFTNYY